MKTIVKTSFFSGALFLVADPIISLWAQPSLSTEATFTLLPADHTGVDFNNFLVSDEKNNQLVYEYISSGGGVAVGDVNNDGLADLYFGGNMTGNRLYLNKGGMVFADVTDSAGVGAEDGWSAGVSMADINLDGYLDIYVCRSFYRNDFEKRRNLLFINNGDGAFSESAAAYGLDDPGFGIQAAFFDYDRDGDLDVYIANHLRYTHYSIDERVKLAREDFFVGGPANQAGSLFIQTKTGAFVPTANQPWEDDRIQEDMGSALFDADNDGDLDLYVASGGTEFNLTSFMYQDRLYFNRGDGRFFKAEGHLPNIEGSGSCVVTGDYDADGDLDLFVGGRVDPGNYPHPAKSCLLANDGGIFSDVTEDYAPLLSRTGLVTSAVWTDFDRDDRLDLVVVGEWMPITFLRNTGEGLVDETAYYGMTDTTGWWNKIIQADLDGDGDRDFAVGNLGLNYKYKASLHEPFQIYTDDFDDNGSKDIVLGYCEAGKVFPVRGRECSSGQMPFIKTKFPTYHDFGLATLGDIFGGGLQRSLYYQAKEFASVVLLNEGNGRYVLERLPAEAQYAPIFGITARDFDGDGLVDLLVAGNFFVSEVETGRADAGTGLFLRGKGDGTFAPVGSRLSGFVADRDVRDMAALRGASGETLILVANNNDRLQVFGAAY